MVGRLAVPVPSVVVVVECDALGADGGQPEVHEMALEALRGEGHVGVT